MHKTDKAETHEKLPLLIAQFNFREDYDSTFFRLGTVDLEVSITQSILLLVIRVCPSGDLSSSQKISDLLLYIFFSTKLDGISDKVYLILR